MSLRTVAKRKNNRNSRQGCLIRPVEFSEAGRGCGNDLTGELLADLFWMLSL